LRSVVLFGSAAEGAWRNTSDINLVVVLRSFQRDQADQFRNPLRAARAACKTSVMFLVESELAVAAEAFAVKFADIGRRRRVLYGDDVFAQMQLTRAAKRQRLVQMLVNLVLRLREQYVLVSLREPQTLQAAADAAGPLRVAAATLLELEGQTVVSGKTALEQVAQQLEAKDWPEVLANLSEARRSQNLPPGIAPALLFRLIELAGALRHRAEQLI
jgi:hypothetical protein